MRSLVRFFIYLLRSRTLFGVKRKLEKYYLAIFIDWKSDTDGILDRPTFTVISEKNCENPRNDNGTVLNNTFLRSVCYVRILYMYNIYIVSFVFSIIIFGVVNYIY